MIRYTAATAADYIDRMGPAAKVRPPKIRLSPPCIDCRWRIKATCGNPDAATYGTTPADLASCERGTR